MQFFRYATSALSLRFSASSSSSRVAGPEGSPPGFLGLPLGFGLSASGPPSRYAFAHCLSWVWLAMPYLDMTSCLVIPLST